MEIRNFIIRSNPDGGLEFKSPYHRGIFKKLMRSLIGKDIWITIDPKMPARSERQNRFYWLYLNIISRETGYFPEELHEYFKNKFLVVGVKEIFGVQTLIPPSTTALSKLEFGEYLDKITVETGIEIPDPDLFQLAPLK